MFALGIHFLNGWMMGKYPSSHEEPEWPPHPDRVFMALAAAYFETDGSDDEKKALVWLEEQELPLLIASDCDQRDVVTSYVPVNDKEISKRGNQQTRIEKIQESKSLSDLKEKGLEILPELRSRQPRTFPVAIPYHPTMYVVWANADVDKQTCSALNALCQKVTYIGHSASLVQMWVEENPPHITQNSTDNNLRMLEPKNGQYTQYQLRIMGKGRLINLENLFNKHEIESYYQLLEEMKISKGKRKKEIKEKIKVEFNDTQPTSLRPTPSLWSGYDVKKPELIETPEPETCFSPHIIILRRIKGKPMPLVSTLQLTRALRNAIIKVCPEPVPEWISGHKEDGTPSEHDHMAIVPLPFVGSEHADGHLLGLSIVIPKSVNKNDIARCFHKLLYRETGMLKDIELKLGRLGVWTLQIEDREENQRQRTLCEGTWTAIHPAKPFLRWGTVTPIAIDRHAKGKDKWAHVEESIKKGCVRIGLPKPNVVIPMPVSAFIGTPHGQTFPKITRKSDKGKIFHTHAIIEFPEPVRGPILIGAGRYRGYGFCRPLMEGGELSS